jgi:hypothetical protein
MGHENPGGRMSRRVRPGRCGTCGAPGDHPPAACPLCGKEFAHIAGVAVHLIPRHKLSPGSRPYVLALDVTRARIRGWPTEPVISRARLVGLEVLAL